MKKLSVLCLSALLFTIFTASAKFDPNIQYLVHGKPVTPWQFSLNFGQIPFDDKTVSTAKGSLTASYSENQKKQNAIRLVWKPKGIKNEWGMTDRRPLTATIINRQGAVNIAPVVENAALTFDIKVNKPPKNNVELMIECGWSWECRSTFPLKNVLKRIKKKTWTTIPIPLKCLTNERFDMTKVTTIFSLYTDGKLDIEISNIQLTALAPNMDISCPGD